MVRIFQILAVVPAGTAAFLFWRDDGDMTFVAGVLAACAFFLSIRYQMKARLVERERHEVAIESESDNIDQ